MKKILSFLKPYKFQLLLVTLLLIADVASALIIPTVTAEIINLAISGGAINEIVKKGGIMLAVSVVSGGLVLYASWLCANISACVGRDLRNAIYDKSLQFSASDFEIFGTGSMITRTLNDINVLQQGIVYFIQMVLPVPFMCILGIIFSFRLNRHIGFLMLAATLLVLASALLIVRKAAPIFERLQKFLDRMNVVLRENLTGVRVIRAFNKEGHETRRMKKTFEDYARSAIQANRLFAGLDSLAMVAINICIVAVVYLGGLHSIAGTMEIGDITAAIEYAAWILFYVIMAQMVIVLMPRAFTCMRRISAVLNHEPEISDGKMVYIENPDDKKVISFENVGFRFADADEETLSGINFSCERGKTTAVIGGTGSGKSTVAKLILRYHDVTRGKITLGGQDVREISQHDLRERIAYVPQKAWLFSGTIAENLRYGKPEASEEELNHALKVAQSSFVFDLPDGLNTRVAQGGTNFSGGQKQRLSIARALVKEADLFIFDDSFSALDFKTDAALRHALTAELKNSAVLIIAQRISTIMNADQIIVLHDGKIVGKGRHEQLLKTCDIYRDIAESQLKGGALNG